jgi:hypothetical protein
MISLSDLVDMVQNSARMDRELTPRWVYYISLVGMAFLLTISLIY